MNPNYSLIYNELLKKRLEQQKGINVKFIKVENANHFFKNKEKELKKILDNYIKDEISIF